MALCTPDAAHQEPLQLSGVSSRSEEGQPGGRRVGTGEEQVEATGEPDPGDARPRSRHKAAREKGLKYNPYAGGLSA